MVTVGGVPYSSGAREELCPSQEKFRKYYPWKLCYMVHFCTTLGFNVDGLNIEVGVNNRGAGTHCAMDAASITKCILTYYTYALTILSRQQSGRH